MTPPTSFDAHFAVLSDPRVDCTKLHSLRDIVTLALRGVLCGAESWVEIEGFSIVKQAWFERRLVRNPEVAA